MKIVFLDIDGVLNCDKTEAKTPSGYVGISDRLIHNLLHLIEATQAKIVLSSSWRQCYKDNDSDGKYLKKKLRQKSLSIYDITELPQHFDRGMEIKHWLEAHKDLDIENFIILDDEFEYEFEYHGFKDNLIHTEYSDGFDKERLEVAINKLNK